MMEGRSSQSGSDGPRTENAMHQEERHEYAHVAHEAGHNNETTPEESCSESASEHDYPEEEEVAAEELHHEEAPRDASEPAADATHSLNKHETKAAPQTDGERERSHHAADAGEASTMPKLSKHSKGTKDDRKVPQQHQPSAPAKRTTLRKKKPSQKVNISNVEHQAPLAEGVNTPRSIALCKKHDINPSELAPFKKDHFKAPGVAEEMVELRYHSYEKRRQARMTQLRSAYKEIIAQEAEAKAAAAPGGSQQASEKLAVRKTAEPGSAHNEEDAEMQRQFDDQHERLMEQERRKAGAGAYDSQGRRRSFSPPQYGNGRSPSGGGSQVPPHRHSSNGSTGAVPITEQPYSAAKIYSACQRENRPLTQSEAAMIEAIKEREARRYDTLERAEEIRENTTLVKLEKEIARERRNCAAVQKTAEERERKQEEIFKRREALQAEAAARRNRLELERKSRIEESIAEKEARMHANNPSTSMAARRRTSGTEVYQGAPQDGPGEQNVVAE